LKENEKKINQDDFFINNNDYFRNLKSFTTPITAKEKLKKKKKQKTDKKENAKIKSVEHKKTEV